MIIKNKKDFKVALKRAKDDSLTFYQVQRILEKGDQNIGVKKDLKELYKLLKHWYDKKDYKDKQYSLYYPLIQVCKELKKDEEAKHYEKLYRLENIKKGNFHGTDFDTPSYIMLELQDAFDKKGRLVKKECLDNAVKYTLKYIDDYKNGQYFSFDTKLKEALNKVFSTDEYGYKKLYLAHFLYPIIGYEKDKYIKDFTNEDISEYVKILDKFDNKFNEDFKKFMNAKNKMLINPKDYKARCEYASLKETRNNYEKYDLAGAYDDYNKYYKEGYEEALIYMIRNLVVRCKTKDAIKLYENHFKKKSKNIDLKLKLADAFYEIAVMNNKLLIGREEACAKAVLIYEENVDELTETQLSRLSKAYELGYGVEIDLKKAKLYTTNDKKQKQLEEEYYRNLKTKIKVKKGHQEEADKLLAGLDNKNEVKIYNLICALNLGKIVEKDNELVFELSNALYELNKKGYGNLALYFCYFDGTGCKKDEKKARKYLEKSVEYKIEKSYRYYLDEIKIDSIKSGDFSKYIDLINKWIEEGFVEFKLDLAEAYHKGYGVEVDLYKAINLYKEAYDNNDKHAGFRLANFYLFEEGVEVDIPKAFKYIKEFDDEFSTPNTSGLLYICAHDSNYTLLSEEEAVKHLIKAADGGIGNCCLYLAVRYLYGKCVKKDKKKFYKYLLKAEEAGVVKSYMYLGDIYFYGDKDLKIEVNYEKAFKYYLDLEEQYPSLRNYELGFLYFRNKQDYEKAYKYFETDYNNGGKGSIRFIGLCYANGYYVKKNLDKAIECYLEGIEYNIAPCAYSLALIYSNEFNDIDKAIEYYKKAIEIDKTYVSAYINLGYHYEEKTDYKKALENYKLALSYNPEYGVALNNIGTFYQNGLIVEKDIKKALDYYLKASNKGLAIASRNAGRIYNNSKEAFYDPDKALTYLNKSLEQEDCEETKGYIADILIWHKKDYKKAYEILNGCEKEVSVTCEEYGDLLYNGFYIPRNYKMAFEYYKKSYDLEQISSNCFKLGRCYFFGHGVEEDKVKAKSLIKLAVQDGYESAKKFYEEYFG